MGYATEFSGAMSITPRLDEQYELYINRFCETRRMKRNEVLCANMDDPIRDAVGLPVGREGSYFVGGKGIAGQGDCESIIDYNIAPADQPSLWCQWKITDHGQLAWDGGEKFYMYTDWLRYLVKHFFDPWGVKLNGEIEWQGDQGDDQGIIYAKDNRIEAVYSKVINQGPSWT